MHVHVCTALSELHIHRFLPGKHRFRLAVSFLLLKSSYMNNARKAHFPGLEGVTMN